MICCMLEEIDHCEIGGIYMHTVEDLENTLKDIFITTESTYNQQVELENLLEEVDPQSLILGTNSPSSSRLIPIKRKP